MGVKEDKLEDSGTHTKPGRHILVPSQYLIGGPLVKEFRGCNLVVGRKEVYFEILATASFGEMPCWDGISSKTGKHGLGHLMHAIV